MYIVEAKNGPESPLKTARVTSHGYGLSVLTSSQPPSGAKRFLSHVRSPPGRQPEALTHPSFATRPSLWPVSRAALHPPGPAAQRQKKPHEKRILNHPIRPYTATQGRKAFARYILIPPIPRFSSPSRRVSAEIRYYFVSHSVRRGRVATRTLVACCCCSLIFFNQRSQSGLIESARGTGHFCIPLVAFRSFSGCN